MTVILNKTWQYDAQVNGRVASVSSILDAASYLLWYMKSLAKGDIAMVDQSGAAIAGGSVLGKWPCLGSSDGTTAALDGTDRWTTTYTPAKLVRATAGTAHSWIVLGPVNGFYLCFDFVGSQDYSADIILAKNAFTGGSTLNRPTATNEQSYFTANSTNRQLVQNVAPAAAHVHGRLCTDGNFWVLRSVDGAGRFEFVSTFQSLTDTMTEDVHNGWHISDFSSGSSPFPYSTLSTLGTTSVLGRGPAGGSVSNAGCAHLATTSGPIFGTITGPDATNSKFPDSPIWAITSGPGSVRGKFVDWKWTVHSDASILQGDCVPITLNAIELMKVGHTLVPANAAPSL